MKNKKPYNMGVIARVVPQVDKGDVILVVPGSPSRGGYRAVVLLGGQASTITTNAGRKVALVARRDERRCRPGESWQAIPDERARVIIYHLVRKVQVRELCFDRGSLTWQELATDGEILRTAPAGPAVTVGPTKIYQCPWPEYKVRDYSKPRHYQLA